MSAWRREAGGLEAQGHPQLHCEFEVTLGYDETFVFLKHLFKTMP